MPGGERILDFAMEPARLSLSLERLVVQREGEPDVTVPLGDAAVVVVSSPRITCTGAVLAALMCHGGSMVVCDETHMPVGMMLPLGVNNEQTKRALAQVAAARPTGKQLWRQIVRMKILAQAHTLRLHRGHDGGLTALAGRVRSGDPSNLEGQAAQRYWPLLFDDGAFRRRRDAPDQNRLLNYGYSVLRAAVGRAICAAGLHPSVGVHHRGRNNAWALADDLMEPYRPLVDDEVACIVGEFGGGVALGVDEKRRLIGVLHARLLHKEESRTVMDWIGRTAASLAQRYLGDTDELVYPEGLHRATGGDRSFGV